MDLDMWKHPSTTSNIAAIQGFGNILIAPGNGELASGLYGEGRMAEPEDIISFISADVKKKLPLVNIKALVTAGPTYEAIDPVRFIGNHSSGKMGLAIADELALLGADVTLVSGPSVQVSKQRSVKRINVTSAAEMLEACQQHYIGTQVCVMSAAVADYTPITIAQQKIKKQQGESLTIETKKTTDILKFLGDNKQAGQLLVGFALETNNEEQNAIDKLRKKNLDFIVLNSLSDAGAGFQGDTNKITIIDRDLQQTAFALKSKEDVAKDICNKIKTLLNK
jgi:phosphopantothenoylcysteine decarboxylase/phosphopantothenate--cysteine ligase